jgi:hypothetical protein
MYAWRFMLHSFVFFMYFGVSVCLRRLCVRASAGVTRVDDPVASIDLCDEADAAAAVAGMICHCCQKVPMRALQILILVLKVRNMNREFFVMCKCLSSCRSPSFGSCRSAVFLSHRRPPPSLSHSVSLSCCLSFPPPPPTLTHTA